MSFTVRNVSKSFTLDRKFSVAPMLAWTDRHERYLLRLISKRILLYTEMITTGALIYGDASRYLEMHQSEHPVAIQLGGSGPTEMARCARLAAEHGYDEININVGCPSDRVQSGRFGACLMAEPQVVADCVTAVGEAVNLDVTVKTRIGIDNDYTYEDLKSFVTVVGAAGCGVFIIHARKAWLKGLSPSQNRSIPPLDYSTVYRLKQDFPEYKWIINGGIADLDGAQKHLHLVDGVMLGRAIYHNPYILAGLDQKYYASKQPVLTRLQVLEQYLKYVEQQIDRGIKVKWLSNHILGLFNGIPGAKGWRRHISEHAHKPGAGIDTFWEAYSFISAAESRQPDQRLTSNNQAQLA